MNFLRQSYLKRTQNQLLSETLFFGKVGITVPTITSPSNPNGGLQTRHALIVERQLPSGGLIYEYLIGVKPNVVAMKADGTEVLSGPPLFQTVHTEKEFKTDWAHSLVYISNN